MTQPKVKQRNLNQMEKPLDHLKVNLRILRTQCPF